jgi:folate-binding protein YgfZ
VSPPSSFAVRLDRDVVRVAGPDALTYLQGQLSQDVEQFPVGRSAFTLLLEPDGKLGFWLRVTRSFGDAFLLDIDGGSGDALVARLERFKLRIDAAVEPLEWSCVALRGDLPDGLAGHVASFDWPGLSGADLFGDVVEIPRGVDEITPDEYESLRVAAGVPRMGSEIDTGRIPAETGVVARSVSFTKGCYTGQELVARVDSRGGNAPRYLRRLTIEGDPARPGDAVLVDGEAVGELTSVARAPGDAATSVALAYVKRSVEVPATGAVGDRSARIEPLPE